MQATLIGRIDFVCECSTHSHTHEQKLQQFIYGFLLHSYGGKFKCTEQLVAGTSGHVGLEDVHVQARDVFL